jgi:hypothetical protein
MRFRTVAYMFTATMVVTIAWLVFGILASCKSTLPPEPDVTVTESGPGASCMTSAENLNALGCPEAADAGAFAQACAHVVETKLEPIDVRCITSASSKAEARACPGVKCP